MKLPALFLLLAWSSIAGVPLTNALHPSVRFSWFYTDAAPSTNLWFNIYGTTNVTTPIKQWKLVTNVTSVNALVTNAGGTIFSLRVPMISAQYFFVMTASNFWGETSLTSQMMFTPPAPQPVNNSVRLHDAP